MILKFTTLKKESSCLSVSGKTCMGERVKVCLRKVTVCSFLIFPKIFQSLQIQSSPSRQFQCSRVTVPESITILKTVVREDPVENTEETPFLV